MSPLAATATSVGWLNSPGPLPAAPGLPSDITSVPLGLNLWTCWPLPGAWPLSATQMSPARSTLILCGLAITPRPKLLSSLPVVSNWRIGSSIESAHPPPPAPDAPQRSITQMVSSMPRAMPAVDPQVRPSGSWPQCTPGPYGFGRSFRAPRCDTAGRLTGNCPGGKVGCAPRPLACGGVAGAPHESASDPGEPVVADDCDWAEIRGCASSAARPATPAAAINIAAARLTVHLPAPVPPMGPVAAFWHNPPMQCPRCQAAMESCALDGRTGEAIVTDICHACQAFWFDAHESPRLSPGSTLALFSVIGARAARPSAFTDGDVAKCPRCSGRLRLTHDRQRNTAFAYLRCPNGHGRLTTFFDFLREKDFVKPLSARQITELGQRLPAVNCSNCGAAVNLAAGGACTHCGSPLSTLDLPHAEELLSQLRHADEKDARPIDPALPLRLAQARREVEQAFASERNSSWTSDAASLGLVGAGLAALSRWLLRNP